MVKISVIIPVYNAGNYLRECLDSVLGQTLQEIEIICVDDGSQDDSMGILEEYQKRDSRISILKQEHKGGGAARNLGLKRATGEYLSFLDADDFFESDMLETAYLRAVETWADIVVYGVKGYHQATGAITDEHSGLRIEYVPNQEIFNWKDMPKHVFNTFHNWPWNKMFLRTFVEQNSLLFQEINRTNDLLFVNKALILAERIAIIDRSLVFYRIQVSGNCQSSNDKYPLDFYKAFLELKKFLCERDIYCEVKQSYMNHAMDACVANLTSLEFGDAYKKLFYALKNEIIKALDINMEDIAQFYSFNYSAYLKIQRILECEYEQFLIERAKWYKKHFVEQLFEDYRKNERIKLLERSKCC